MTMGGFGRTTCALLIPGFLDPQSDAAIAALSGDLRATGVHGHVLTKSDLLSPSDHLRQVTRLLDDQAVDGGRVILVGHCYGAHLALLAAAADPRITDVVAIMPTRCFIWPEDYDPARDTWRADGERSFLRERDGELHEFRVPYLVVEDARRHDLPAALRRLRQRVLFVAGEQDELIGVDPVRLLFDECGSPDKELAVLPVQHDYRDLPDQIETVDKCVLNWLGVAENQDSAAVTADF